RHTRSEGERVLPGRRTGTLGERLGLAIVATDDALRRACGTRSAALQSLSTNAWRKFMECGTSCAACVPRACPLRRNMNQARARGDHWPSALVQILVVPLYGVKVGHPEAELLQVLPVYTQIGFGGFSGAFLQPRQGKRIRRVPAVQNAVQHVGGGSQR